MLQQLLGATDGAGQGSNLVLVAPPQAAGDSGPPPPNQVMLIYPSWGAMLQGDVTEFLMGGGNPGVPPASKATIKGLRTVEAGEVQKEESCPVCLDEYGVEMEAKEMPCKHQFHEGCIEKWLGMHGSCPVCRFEMQGEQEKATQVDEPERVATPVVTMETGRSSGWGRGSERFDHNIAIGVEERRAANFSNGWGEGWTDFDHTPTVSTLIEIWHQRASGGPEMQVDESERVTMPVEEERVMTMEVEERRATDSSNGWERDHTRTISALIELWQRRASCGH